MTLNDDNVTSKTKNNNSKYLQKNKARLTAGWVATVLCIALASNNLYASEAHHDHDHVEEHDEHEHDEHEHDEHEHDEHEHEHDEHEHEHDEHEHQIAPAQTVAQNRNLTHADIVARTDIAISNYPLFLISEAVTQGAPSGKLLLDAGDIGHHGSLSPSDVKTINDSRYVVWFGDELETNLANTLANYNNSIALYDLPLAAFHREPLRDVQGNDIAQTLDPHIWLDPENAKAIARALGALYSRANPQNKALYERNVIDFSHQMDNALAEVRGNLPYQGTQPYWAYHDAFQYIEPSLNLSLAGALTTDHHLPPRASQYVWLQQNRPNSTMCMVMQNSDNLDVSNKLVPLNTTVQQEDMSQNEDFVSGWKAMATAIVNCVQP